MVQPASVMCVRQQGEAVEDVRLKSALA